MGVVTRSQPALRYQHVVWMPLPGSQMAAIGCRCNHILYHGTRGPGKTDTQLMAFRKHVGKGYGKYWRGIIFDREYKNLDDLVAKSKKWFPLFGDGARFLESKADYKWVWPTGEELLFRVVKKASDYEKYHGHEYPFIGWNELTKYPTPELYNELMSCNRSSFLPAEHSPPNPKTGRIEELLPEIPLIVFSTTNPHGPGHNWVKRKFIDVAEAGQIVRVTTNVFNPRTKQREDVTKTQVAIFGSYKENRYLSPEYIAELERITDPNKRKAWLWGDWDIVAGGALDDVWGPHCIVPRFPVPDTWRLDRTFDWGSTHPFSVGFWAEANGEEVLLPNGQTFCPAAGSFIRIDEWYGCTEIGVNKGLKYGAKKIAKGILEHQKMLLDNGWISGDIEPGPADNEIRNVKNADTETIAKQMEDEGVFWTSSDKSKGSRKQGLELLRERLEAAKTGEGPAIYYMDNCRAAISILPTIPRDPDNPDDVDTDSEDHLYDECRYKVLAGSNRISTGIGVSFPS